MREDFFHQQIARLKTRFGDKAFDNEFIKVLSLEVAKLPDEFFRRQIDTWIGTRKNNNPPLLTEFKEARLAYERNQLNKEVNQASTGFQSGLKEALRKHYNVDSIQEAFEIERLKIVLGGIDEKGRAK
jgi:hypothetical protein